MGREIIEKAVIVGALSIFETLEMNLARLILFSVVNFFASVGNIHAAFNFIHDVELKSPNNVRRIFDSAGLFETLEGNGLIIVGTIERADDDEGGVGIALKFFEFADSIVNAEFNVVNAVGNNLEIVDANDRGFIFAVAERTEEIE